MQFNPHKYGTEAYWTWNKAHIAEQKRLQKLEDRTAILELWHAGFREPSARSLGRAATILRKGCMSHLSQNAARSRIMGMNRHCTAENLLLVCQHVPGRVWVCVENINDVL